MLLTKVKDTIRKYGMLNAGDRVVVAVSGGPDSVCLLSALQALAKDLNPNLHIAHLYHSFLGITLPGAELLVVGLAKKITIRPRAYEHGDSVRRRGDVRSITAKEAEARHKVREGRSAGILWLDRRAGPSRRARNTLWVFCPRCGKSEG